MIALRGDLMLSTLISNISLLFPAGMTGLFTIFFYSVGVFIIVGVVTAFVSIINHVRGLISRV